MGVKGWGLDTLANVYEAVTVETYSEYYPNPRREDAAINNAESTRIRPIILSPLQSLVTSPRSNHLRIHQTLY
jgi:hypothetical protein